MGKSVQEIGVVGLGFWGTALAEHLASQGKDVLAWTASDEAVERVNTSHEPPSKEIANLLNAQKLSKTLRATTELATVTSRPFIVLALPSAVIVEVLRSAPPARESLVVSGIKGFTNPQCETPLEGLKKVCDSSIELAVLSGPSFAADLLGGLPIAVVAASRSEESAYRVAEVFQSDTMRVYTSVDPLGVELGGILKNVIAIAVGMSDGLGLGDSARAGLISRGLAEMTRLATVLGADERTLAGLSGLGDLVMTASCDKSRNRTVGLRLGQGEKLKDIIESLGSVAEGVRTAPFVRDLAHRNGVEVPITEVVCQIVEEGKPPREMLWELMKRPIRAE